MSQDRTTALQPGWQQREDLSVKRKKNKKLARHGGHHAWLIFVFLAEMEFCHVGQAGVELTSGALPASTSQSAGITGVSHSTWPSQFLNFL